MSAPRAQVVDDEDFAQIRAQVREFVREEVVPREQEIVESDAIPSDLRQKAADMGLFGYALPQEHGGLGLVITQDVELAFELGYTALSFRSLFGTNNGIAGQVLVGYGTDEQRKQWLEPMAEGRCIASFALTEPEAGSDPSGMRATATWTDGGWVIDGQKRYITNAPFSDLLVTFAKVRGVPETQRSGARPSDSETQRSGARPSEQSSDDRIAVFLVPTTTAGVVVGPKDRKMGQEGASSSEVTFDGVRVGPEALVSGEIDTGFRAAMSVLARGRVHIAALAMGLSERALDESVAYSAVNRQGGVPTGERQLVQAMLAEQASLVMAGKATAREAAARYLDGSDRRIGPSAAKLFCTEAAGKVADLAVQVHGGAGYMREMAVERLYRDVRLLRLYEGTSEIQKLIVGRELIRREQARA